MKFKILFSSDKNRRQEKDLHKSIKRSIPFLDEEELEDLLWNIINSESLEYEGITVDEILPFVDEDVLGEASLEYYSRGGDIHSFLPFMDEDDVDQLAEEIASNHGNIKPLLPFMSDDGIEELMNYEYLDEEMSLAALPYADEEAVYSAYKRAYENGEDISPYLPFMDDDDVDEAFMQAARDGRASSEYYPFISEDVLHDILTEYIKGNLDFDFDDVYPYMDDDDIRELFRFRSRQKKEAMED